MKAIQVAEFGGPEVLKLNEIATPKPEAGQVLIKVHAVGVNPYDTYMRTGTYAIKPPLPYIPGSDAAGVVEAVGAGVKSLKAGDRVRIGGFGIIQVKDRPARMGRNPATGEAIQIEASRKIAFRAAKELKDAI